MSSTECWILAHDAVSSTECWILAHDAVSSQYTISKSSQRYHAVYNTLKICKAMLCGHDVVVRVISQRTVIGNYRVTVIEVTEVTEVTQGKTI